MWHGRELEILCDAPARKTLVDYPADRDIERGEPLYATVAVTQLLYSDLFRAWLNLKRRIIR